MDAFLATLFPMLSLFICIAAGFAVYRCKLLPENAGKTIANLETWIFCPALSFMTMLRFCSMENLQTHAINIGLASCCVAMAVAIAIPLSHLFVRKKSPERGVYAYALAFANSGYMGDPVVQAMFGDMALSYYKLFCLPLSVVIYTWGMSALVPDGNERGSFLKKFLNPPTVAMFVGMAAGILGAEPYVPSFLLSALDTLKACMAPGAMILAGITIARFDVLAMLKNVKIYAITLLRLFVFPLLTVGLLFVLKLGLAEIFSIEVGNYVLFLGFFATGSALGLNTVVFPEAYGGNPETGAGMALISHTLCVVSIPIMYTLLVSWFGPFVI